MLFDIFVILPSDQFAVFFYLACGNWASETKKKENAQHVPKPHVASYMWSYFFPKSPDRNITFSFCGDF